MWRRCAPIRFTRRAISKGFANRDVLGTTIQARRVGGPIVFSSTTGFLNWKTQDVTDLDYTPRPILTRDNTEKDFQFTQEIRFASADNRADPARGQRPAAMADRRVPLHAGLPAGRHQQLRAVPVRAISASASTRRCPSSTTSASGVFGQGTVTFNDRLDLTAGARVDYEDKSATLENFYDPAIAPGTLGRRRQELLERLAAGGARLSAPAGQDALCDGRAADTRPAGSTPASPAGSEAYGEERTWHFEGGAKTLWANGRMSDERRRLLHRLGRPAAERPQSGRAGAVLHLQRRRRRQQGRRGGGQRAGRRRASTCSRRWATRTRASRREASRAA